jgi:sigma-54 dependent transcriptional regulator, acetoin dehydrogenase operon transcriptional activator AcoR
LQEREFQPLGASVSVKADVRIIAATKEDLSHLVENKSFRDDLLFRLNVVRLNLPSLAERRDDIPLLVSHFVEKFNRKMERQISGVDDDTMVVLMQYRFPGNIRELENIIEHAFVMCREKEIKLSHLPPEFTQLAQTRVEPVQAQSPLHDSERQTIVASLDRHGWNKLETARELNLHRTSLWRKMKKHGLA